MTKTPRPHRAQALSQGQANLATPTQMTSPHVWRRGHWRVSQSLCSAAAAAWLATAGCTHPIGTPPTTGDRRPPAAPAQGHPAPRPSASEANTTPASAPNPQTCGALGCRLFDTAEQAMQVVLQSNPKVLAVGEAHAQKGTEHIPSTARRFTETFLPLLAGRAKSLVMELPIADGHCGKSEEAAGEVAKQVTREQAESNPNEYVALATRARALDIIPYPLRFGCEQYRQIAQAGPNDIASALTVIAQAMEQEVIKRLAEYPNGLVLTYGGALHNDLQPDPSHAAWSFGPALSKATANATVELDLIVREYIKDDEIWRAFPWSPVFDPREHPDSLVLYQPSPRSFVLIFPATKQGAP